MSKSRKRLISANEPLATVAGIRTPIEQLQDSNALVISSVVVCNSSYNELDDTAVGTSGGYLKIKGTGFVASTTVYLNGSLINPTVTSASELRITVPTLTVGTYSLMVFNTAAVGAIWAAGLVISGFPVWSTTTIATANLTVNTQLVATGDATLVYTLASGSLPPGVTLSSSGLLSGTVSPVPSTDTVYNFTVDVKDAQNQNLAQAITFSLTVVYLLPKSLRFRSAASTYLNRTPATTTTDRTAWTYSAWVKLGGFTSSLVTNAIFVTGTSSSNYMAMTFTNGSINDQFAVLMDGYYKYWTNALFRDPAAWYHITVAFNSNAAAASRIKIYVNGVQLTTVVNNEVASGYSSAFGVNTNPMYIGKQSSNAGFTTWYYSELALTEVKFIDSQALDPTYFGAFSVYGQWLPKNYTGTYGTNGFYLPFTGSTTTTYAGLFNGSSQYLATASLPAIGTSNFTMEGWFYITGAVVTNGSNPRFWALQDINMVYDTSTSQVRLDLGTSTAQYITTANQFTFNAWNHLAIVRSGTSVKVYLNGVSQVTITRGDSLAGGVGYIGSYNNVSGYLQGYISNFRSVNGTALYSTNFIPPTSPLTAVTNTTILTLQGSSIVDNSGNNYAITNGNTVVTSIQSPFGMPTIAADYSGNANHWVPNAINVTTAGSTYDSLTDVPTLTSATAANYAVLNPLDCYDLTNGSMTNGNLSWAGAYGSINGHPTRSTLRVPASGKWYVESKALIFSGSGNSCIMGFTNSTQSIAAASPFAGTITSFIGVDASVYTNTVKLRAIGVQLYPGTVDNTTLFAACVSGDVINFAIDFTLGKIWIGKNGTWYNSGDPVAGTNPTCTFIANFTDYAFLVEYVAASDNSNRSNAVVNFGQQPFAYTQPTGYLCMNTYNLGTDPYTYFAAPISYLVVAGGGSASGTQYGGPAGGGGAGGYRAFTNVSIPSGVALPVTIGAGAGVPYGAGGNGSNSSFFNTGSSGGGGGYYYYLYAAGSGGSGGGGGGNGAGPGGTGNIGGYSPVEGYNGGSSNYSGGGGGGAGGAGGTASGGPGLTWLNGVTYAAGGWGTTPGANTGGGGIPNGGAGASGAVVIRYADSYVAATATTGSPTIVVSGGFRTYTFTSSGTITF